MGKKTAPRDLPDTEAKAFAASIRTSPRKLNLVAQSIRGLKAEVALAQLTFSPRRVAEVVKKVLQSAIANAENNHQLDVDRLIVAEAYVGKAMVMKRFSPRARGRVGRIVKPFSNLTVIVREHQEPAAQEQA
ncbi:MAG TPA: 50S ribosomal protein L22 [Rhodospirillaceae bacterium]|nr:50S ribosomal protein L22 [Rhodospirillaceae bacterium]